MPTASAVGFITNTGNTPTTYRARLVVQRFTPDMANYLDALIGAWSPTTASVPVLANSLPFTVPPVTFTLPGEYFAQARVQVSGVSPPNDLAGFSSWGPEPPFRAGGVISGAWSGGPTVASVAGPRVLGEFSVKITDQAEAREMGDAIGRGILIVAGLGVGLFLLFKMARRSAGRR
jgi:hypothetical protein